ncbi:hypothetical protein ILUMI_14818 [Ignelater luminosus]|uniref:Uncharacterized protein n=1 Tax=Ignelater luminosus TaxID=2038154 RepID=A0A8K0CXV7_IGNLU|nr:hypothetical protein ILUMI_14818 [Ignelater luminosus]
MANTKSKHKEIYKFTWERRSKEEKSIIDCILAMKSEPIITCLKQKYKCKKKTPKAMKGESNEKKWSYKLTDPEARAKYQKELEKSVDITPTEESLD